MKEKLQYITTALIVIFTITLAAYFVLRLISKDEGTFPVGDNLGADVEILKDTKVEFGGMQTLAICDTTLKTNEVRIDGVDVLARIAELLKEERNMWICKGVEKILGSDTVFGVGRNLRREYEYSLMVFDPIQNETLPFWISSRKNVITTLPPNYFIGSLRDDTPTIVVGKIEFFLWSADENYTDPYNLPGKERKFEICEKTYEMKDFKISGVFVIDRIVKLIEENPSWGDIACSDINPYVLQGRAIGAPENIFITVGLYNDMYKLDNEDHAGQYLIALSKSYRAHEITSAPGRIVLDTNKNLILGSDSKKKLGFLDKEEKAHLGEWLRVNTSYIFTKLWGHRD